MNSLSFGFLGLSHHLWVAAGVPPTDPGTSDPELLGCCPLTFHHLIPPNSQPLA